MDEHSLTFARELERADGAVDVALREVGELQQAVDELHARARRTAAFLAALPDERERAEAGARRAAEDLDARRAEATHTAGARADAERSGRDDRVDAARRTDSRAADAAALAEARLARAREALQRLSRREETARLDAAELERVAAELAARLRSLPRLSRRASDAHPAGLAGVVEWASWARAALWVVRSGLEAERERLVREANELSASVLGEPVAATSVTLVRRRIETALAGRTGDLAR